MNTGSVLFKEMHLLKLLIFHSEAKGTITADTTSSPALHLPKES